MKLTNISLILFLIVIPYSLFADEKGSLLVRNFSPTEYEGGSKIYSVASTTNGLMYAGDKNGIIEFDGETPDLEVFAEERVSVSAFFK